MSQTIPHFASWTALQDKLAVILQSGPLYRRFFTLRKAAMTPRTREPLHCSGCFLKSCTCSAPHNNARKNSNGSARLERSIFVMTFRNENTSVTTARESLVTNIFSSGTEKKERGCSRK